MNQPRIGIIISTTRPTRIGPAIARLIQQAAPADVHAEIVDLAEVDLPFLADLDMPRNSNYDTPEAKAWSQTVTGFDGFIVALGEYNAGYPAPLKNALDTLYAEWSGKPFGIVGYGWYGGKRAITALDPVLGNLGAVRVGDVALAFKQEIDLDGTPIGDNGASLAQLWDEIKSAVGSSTK